MRIFLDPTGNSDRIDEHAAQLRAILVWLLERGDVTPEEWERRVARERAKMDQEAAESDGGTSEP